jgi:hypothetical protein
VVDHRAIGKFRFCIRLSLGPDRLDDELLQLDRRYARDMTGVLFTALKEDVGDIIAIMNAVLVGVAGRQAIAAGVMAAETRSEIRLRPQTCRANSACCCQMNTDK